MDRPVAWCIKDIVWNVKISELVFRVEVRVSWVWVLCDFKKLKSSERFEDIEGHNERFPQLFPQNI